MFKDAEEELERLQDALLSEDQDDDESEPDAEFLDEPELPEDFESYNADHLDIDLESFSEELLQKPHRSLTGLAIFAVLVTLGTVALVAWWVLSRTGVL